MIQNGDLSWWLSHMHPPSLPPSAPCVRSLSDLDFIYMNSVHYRNTVHRHVCVIRIHSTLFVAAINLSPLVAFVVRFQEENEKENGTERRIEELS
jgi:hypothetical protein